MSHNNPICLIDADVIAFAGASIGQDKEVDDDGEVVINVHRFTNVESYIVNMVESIMEACESTSTPYMFLSGKTNFRFEVATVKPYKGTRPKEKPFHLANARAFIQSRYNTYTSVGCEADDLMAMAMTSYRKQDIPSIICTVDKDLLQVEGWHYRWEGHNFGETLPHFVDKLGTLEGEYDEGVSEKTKKPYKKFISKSIKGDGYLWLMAQTLLGDVVDNIPGLEGCGPKATYELLHGTTSCVDALALVVGAYYAKYGDDSWEERLTEQARLVYMVKERDPKSPDGLKHWSLKDAYKEART